MGVQQETQQEFGQSTMNRTRKINYPKDQKFFHSSDIPDHIKAVVKEVKGDIDPDILGRKQKRWNQSVYVDVIDKEIDERAQQFQIRKGLNDTKLVDPKPQLIYQGTETRDDYTGWNVSTELIPRLQRDREIEEETLVRMGKTRITNDQIMQSYQDPIKKTQTVIKKHCTEKHEDPEMRKRIEAEIKLEMP